MSSPESSLQQMEQEKMQKTLKATLTLCEGDKQVDSDGSRNVSFIIPCN